MPMAIKVIAALVLLSILLLPSVLILLTALRIRRRSNGSCFYAIFLSGLLFVISSLGPFTPVLVTEGLDMTAEEAVRISAMLSYIESATRYLGLLLLGLGLWLLSGKLEKQKADNLIASSPPTPTAT